MSIQCKYARAEDAKKAGWFSRRHQTSQAHFAAKEKRQEKFRLKMERVKTELAKKSSVE